MSSNSKTNEKNDPKSHKDGADPVRKDPFALLARLKSKLSAKKSQTGDATTLEAKPLPRPSKNPVVRKIRALKGGVGEIFVSLGSSDIPTRKMSAFFWLSLLSLVTATAVMFDRYSVQKGIEHQARAEIDQHEREATEAADPHKQVPKKSASAQLGDFQLELKPSKQGVRSGGLASAELEVVVECDSDEACHHIDENLAAARNEIVTVLVAIDREDLLSIDGKSRLKRKILETLNDWLPAGKVKNVYFARLLIT